MSDGAISQDEIDALLSGVDTGGISSSGFSSSAPVSIDTTTISNFIGDTVDSLATNLDTMTGVTFQVGTPVVESLDRDGVLKKIPEMVVAVMTDYNSGLVGDHIFLLAPEFAQKITGLINKEENPELDDMALSVVSEVVSQQAGSEITKLAQTGKLPDLAGNPAEAVHVPKAMVRFPQGHFVLVTYPISVEGSAFSLWEVFGSDVANGMISALGGNVGGAASTGGLSAAEMQSMTGMDPTGQMNGGMGMNMGGMNMPNMGMGMQNNMGMANMGMGMQSMGMPQQMGMNMGMNAPNVQSLQYPNLQSGFSGMEQGNIGLIMDVYMEMTVELGRTKKLIKDILGMGEGTIIELDKLAGEPVDILVNHKPIAKGEVVVIDENFGVRVTEILSPMERVSDLH